MVVVGIIRRVDGDRGRALLGRPTIAGPAAALATAGIAAYIAGTDCMSGCTRASTIAFRAPGKMAYLFGDLTAADLPDLLVFARLYAASPDGTRSGENRCVNHWTG